jgi:phosphoinositide-3-kinase regulatory subunit 4
MRPGSSLVQNANNVTATDDTMESFPSDSDHRLEKLWADYESVEPYLGQETMEETVMDVKLEYATNLSGVSRPFQVSPFIK